MSQQPGLYSTSLGLPIGKNTIQQPMCMIQMSGARSPFMQQLPCKTINDITQPPAKISNVNLLYGYKPTLLGRGDTINATNIIGYFPEHPINTPLPPIAGTFFY